MTISAGSSQSKMSWARGRSPGWAAFDLKRREKQGLEHEFDTDPYPPIPNAITSVPPFKNSVTSDSPSAKSFSSVVQPSVDFPILKDNSNNSKRQILVGSSSRKLDNKVEKENNIIPSFEKLKELHSWADDDLIEDILASVHNNFDQASTLLKAMVFSGSSENTKTTNLAEQRSALEDCIHDKKTEQVDEVVPLENTADLADLRSALEDCLQDNKTEETVDYVPIETKLANSTTHVQLISGHLISAPVEPEWEEDDVYLSHRKDAIRVIRSATQHSRAASNAFLKGDHFSAKQLSLKARGEWIAADMLNAKAAQEILSIKNSKNDVWKLDLHGLHASEAVHALQEHLWKIETQIPWNRSVSPKRIVKPKAGIVRSPIESVNSLGMEVTTHKEQAISWQRPTVLQVITGTGNHSRGQAALPVAVRSFLIENGYRFDEARPGVIAVRPKFRHR